MPSAGAMIVRAATSTSSSSPKGALPPISIVFICAGFIAITMFSLCMWRKLLSGEAFQPVLVHIPIARGRKNDGDSANDRPEMFDTWTERCTSKNLKWEEYVPFSVTVLTASGPDREAGRLRGESARVRRETDKQDQGICRLQVGVLVAMPSQLHTKPHDRELSWSTLRGGMAIGLTEMPWIEEGCR
ncbi:hypothetical protein EDB92DRAFT_272276 [Lactarius akahatsu]|uniref:Uncharacterized protein n=1 Tax=Lactarius akahatsu TaxID=416441 RepID=A0AAD4L4X7_9AGAM|nr:hypothetical protein EDB92DRAFT_272276 [Lactarius akahatsu]